MKGLLEEICEIPDKAYMCYQKNLGIKLPLNAPYLGMGSSYNAPLTLFYCGKNINPQLASEYYHYLSRNIRPLGVLISQSGETSEIIWNLERFKKVIAITNNPNSSFGKARKKQKLIELYAGEEKFPSTKTYINTLIVLYLGLGINPLRAIKVLEKDFDNFKHQAKYQAEEIFKYTRSRCVNPVRKDGALNPTALSRNKELRIYSSQLSQGAGLSNGVKGLHIIGSGPNIGTAREGALTLSETTKMAWVGMSAAEYDHGPKETAENSVLVILNSLGRDKERLKLIKKRLRLKSNALIIELTETNLKEELSPFTFICRLNLIMNYLADLMKINEAFRLGAKITKVAKK